MATTADGSSDEESEVLVNIRRRVYLLRLLLCKPYQHRPSDITAPSRI
jgi:hypothetical protein